jgi:cell division protein FtsB
MSIDMYLGQARSQASSVKSVCNQLAQGYSSLMQSNQQFIGSGELSSKGYNSAKEFFSAIIQPLVQGAEVGAEMTAVACQKFVDQYTAEVDSIDLKSEELERRIQQLNTSIINMENINRSLPKLPTGTNPLEQANRRIIHSLETTKRDLEGKLEKLLAFNASSLAIFSEVNAFYSTLAQGLKQANSSFDSASGTFSIPKGKDLDWAKKASNKYLENKMQQIMRKIPDLASDDWETILEFAKENPDAEVPKELQVYLKENKDDIVSDIKNDVLSNFIEQLGMGVTRFAGLINVLEGIMGPNTSNSFILVNPNGIGTQILKYGKNITTAGKALGYGFMAAGFGLGMYNDINDGKTVGQAISHNVVSTGVGFGAGMAGTAGVGLLLTNPGGWAILGGIAVGTVVSVGFDFAYQNNFLGLQDGLDWAGNKIDEGIDWAGEKFNDGMNYAKEKLDDVGEAISNLGDALNPMNWAW